MAIDKLLSIKQDEFERRLSVWEKNAKLPFFYSFHEMYEFSGRVEEVVKIIKASNNPRIIILESWLLIDFTIRHLLLHGLGLNKFDHSKLDLLPKSFDTCLKLLKKLIKDQSGKEKNPSLDALGLPGDFIQILLNDREFIYKLMQYEEKYLRDKHPEVFKSHVYEPHNPKFRNVSDAWLQTVELLDDDWFRFASDLNKARNIAAHEHNNEFLFSSLKIQDGQMLDVLRAKCLEFLNKLIKVKIEDDQFK